MQRTDGCVTLEKGLPEEPAAVTNGILTGNERLLSVTSASCLSSNSNTPALDASEAKCQTGDLRETFGKEIWANCTEIYPRPSQGVSGAIGLQSSQQNFSHATTDEVFQRRIPRDRDIETGRLVNSHDSQDKYQDTVHERPSHKFENICEYSAVEQPVAINPAKKDATSQQSETFVVKPDSNEISVSDETVKKESGVLVEKPCWNKPQDCENTNDHISLVDNLVAQFFTEIYKSENGASRCKPDGQPSTRCAHEDKPYKAANFSTSSLLWQPENNDSNKETESATESCAVEILHNAIPPRLQPARYPNENVLPVLNSPEISGNVEDLLQRRNSYHGNSKECGQSKTMNSTAALVTHNRRHQETPSNDDDNSEDVANRNDNRLETLRKNAMTASSGHLCEEEMTGQGRDKNVHKKTVSAEDFDGENKEEGTDGEILGKYCLHKAANEHFYDRNVKANSQYVKGPFERKTGKDSVKRGKEKSQKCRGPENRLKRKHENSTSNGSGSSLSLRATIKEQTKGERKIQICENKMDVKAWKRQRGSSPSKSNANSEQDSLVSCSCISSKYSPSDDENAPRKHSRKPKIPGINATSSTEGNSSESEDSRREEERNPSTTCLSRKGNRTPRRERKWQSPSSYQETDSENDSNRTGGSKAKGALTQQRGSERRRNSSGSPIGDCANSDSRRTINSRKKRRKQRKNSTGSSGSDENTYGPRRKGKKYSKNRKIRRRSSFAEDSVSTDGKSPCDSSPASQRTGIDYNLRRLGRTASHSEDCFGRVVSTCKKDLECGLKQQRRHRNPEQSTRNSSSSPEQGPKRRKRRKSLKKKEKSQARRGKTNSDFISEDKERTPSQSVTRSKSSFREKDEPGHNKCKERCIDRGAERDRSRGSDRDSDREGERTSSRNRDMDRQRERDNSRDRKRKRDKSKDVNRERDNSRDSRDREGERDNSSNRKRESERTISRDRERERERGDNSKDKKRERDNSKDKDRQTERTNSRDRGKERERYNSREKDRQAERTDSTEGVRCRLRDESASRDGNCGTDKDKSSDRKISGRSSRERKREKTSSTKKVKNKPRDRSEDGNNDRENGNPRKGDRQRCEGNEERGDWERHKDRKEFERTANSGNEIAKGKEKSIDIDRERIREDCKEKVRDASKMKWRRSDKHKEKEREKEGSADADSEGSKGITQKKGRESTKSHTSTFAERRTGCEKEGNNKKGNKEKEDTTERDSKRDKDQEHEKNSETESSKNENSHRCENFQKRKTRPSVGERRRSRTRSAEPVSKGLFIARNAAERRHETTNTSNFQNDPNRRTKSQAWSKWRLVRRLFNAETKEMNSKLLVVRPTCHTTQRTQTPPLTRRPPQAPPTKPRRKREAEPTDECITENSKRKRFDEEDIMPYQGFVDSQVMSLFGFLTRGCVKSLYECPFFVENKQDESKQEHHERESRGWFLTEKQWVTWSAKDEDESDEQGANLMLVWNAIPAWMGLMKPKPAAEKYIRNPVILKPVDKAPLNIESAGSRTGRDTAADHTSRLPSPRSPLEFHQPKEKEGNQGTESTTLSGFAETRTTYSLTTSLCFHFPDFAIPNTQQPEPPQMYQEFQEDTSKVNYSSDKNSEDFVRLQIPMEEDTSNTEETSSRARENHVDTEVAAMTIASATEEDVGKVSSRTRVYHVNTESAVKAIAPAVEVDIGETYSVARVEHVNTEYPEMTMASRPTTEITQAQASKEICTTPRVGHVKHEYPGTTIASSVATFTNVEQVSQGDHENTELPSKTIASVVVADANYSSYEKPSSRARAGHLDNKSSGKIVGATSKQQETPCRNPCSSDEFTSSNGQTSVVSWSTNNESENEVRPQTKHTPPEARESSLSLAKLIPDLEKSRDVPMINPEFGNPSVIRQATSLALKDVLADEEADNKLSSIRPELPASCLNLKITSTAEIVSVSPSSAPRLLVTPVVEMLDVNGTKHAIQDTSKFTSTSSSIELAPASRLLVKQPETQHANELSTAGQYHAKSTTTGSKSGQDLVPSKVTSHNETAKGALTEHLPVTTKQSVHVDVGVKLHTSKIAHDHVTVRNTTREKQKPAANTTKNKADGVKRNIARSRPKMTAINTRDVTTTAVIQQRRLRSRAVPLQTDNSAMRSVHTARTRSVPLVAKKAKAITEKQSSSKPKHAAVTSQDTTGGMQTSAELNPRTSSHRPAKHLVTERRCVGDPRLCADKNSIYLQNSLRQTSEKNTTTAAVTEDLARRGLHQPARDSILRGPTLYGTIGGHSSAWNINTSTRSDRDPRIVSTKSSNADSAARSETLEPASKRSTSSTLSSSVTTERSPNSREWGAGKSWGKGYPPQRSDMRQGPVDRYENRPSVSASPDQYPSSSISGEFAAGRSSEKGKGRQVTDTNKQNAPRRREEFFGSEIRSSVPPAQALPGIATRRRSEVGEVSRSTRNDVPERGNNSTRTADTSMSVSPRRALTGPQYPSFVVPGEIPGRKAESYSIGTVRSVDTAKLTSDGTSFRERAPNSPPPPPPPPPPPGYNPSTCSAPVTSEHAVAYEAQDATKRTLTQTQIYYYPIAGQQFVDSSMNPAQTMSGLFQANDTPLYWQDISAQSVYPSASLQYQGLTGSATDAAWGYPQSKAVNDRSAYLPPRDFSVPGYYPSYGASQLCPYMGHPDQRSRMRQGPVERYENRPSVSSPPHQHPMAPNPYTNRLHPGDHYRSSQGFNSNPGPYDHVTAGFWR